MQLLAAFLYRVRTTGPLPSTSGSPRGERQYWIVSEAELEGERIRATLAAPGSDWMWVSDDGFWRPNVRAPFTTHDGRAGIPLVNASLFIARGRLLGSGRIEYDVFRVS